MQKYDEITAKRVPEAVLAAPDQFDEIWDQYMADLDAIDIDQLESEFNKLIQERLELWSK